MTMYPSAVRNASDGWVAKPTPLRRLAFGAGSGFGWSLAARLRCIISWLACSPTATSYIATWTTSATPFRSRCSSAASTAWASM
ncbi:Uncharacterised protein [Mycobacterium tuberculosis]|nr:Uncharacterised protein [Mycobacterium tuberculosis]